MPRIKVQMLHVNSLYALLIPLRYPFDASLYASDAPFDQWRIQDGMTGSSYSSRDPFEITREVMAITRKESMNHYNFDPSMSYTGSASGLDDSSIPSWYSFDSVLILLDAFWYLYDAFSILSLFFLIPALMPFDATLMTSHNAPDACLIPSSMLSWFAFNTSLIPFWRSSHFLLIPPWSFTDAHVMPT